MSKIQKRNEAYEKGRKLGIVGNKIIRSKDEFQLCALRWCDVVRLKNTVTKDQFDHYGLALSYGAKKAWAKNGDLFVEEGYDIDDLKSYMSVWLLSYIENHSLIFSENKKTDFLTSNPTKTEADLEKIDYKNLYRYFSNEISRLIKLIQAKSKDTPSVSGLSVYEPTQKANKAASGSDIFFDPDKFGYKKISAKERFAVIKKANEQQKSDDSEDVFVDGRWYRIVNVKKSGEFFRKNLSDFINERQSSEGLSAEDLLLEKEKNDRISYFVSQYKKANEKEQRSRILRKARFEASKLY